MKVLLFSNSAWGKYGYSIITTPVAQALRAAGHEVYYFGMQSIHPQFRGSDGITYLGLRHDLRGADILPDLIRAYGIDCLITFHDIWMQGNEFFKSIKRDFPQLRWVHHTTIFSSPLHYQLKDKLAYPDVLVAPSKFNLLELKKTGFSNKTIMIPHATDTSVFKPLPEDQVESFKSRMGLQDKEFVACCTMKNKGMNKGLPTLFLSWKKFLDKNPKLRGRAVLVILSDPMSHEGFPLLEARKDWALEDDIMMVWTAEDKESGEVMMVPEGTPGSFVHNTNYGFPSSEMALLYNASDVMITASRGESFSLPVIESMACGTPVIFNKFSTGPELVGESGAGWLAEILTTDTLNIVSEVAIVDDDSLADCIQKAYDAGPDERLRLGGLGVDFVKKNYAWELILPQWVDLIRKVDESGRRLDFSKGQLGV